MLSHTNDRTLRSVRLTERCWASFEVRGWEKRVELFETLPLSVPLSTPFLSCLSICTLVSPFSSSSLFLPLYPSFLFFPVGQIYQCGPYTITFRLINHSAAPSPSFSHSFTSAKKADTGAKGENVVWNRVCVCVLFFCVPREQLFVKGEMGSIRGPDGIQLRQIKWWWIAVGQQRRTLLWVWAHAHPHSYTHRKTAEGGSSHTDLEKEKRGQRGEEGK